VPERVRSTLTWLRSPAVEHGRAGDIGLLVLRVTLGLMWFYNVAWKRAPDFGREAGNGLYRYTAYAVEYPVLPPYSWLVENAVLPAIVPFGYMVIVAETTAAVLLLTGKWVRIGALVGLAQSIAIGLSVMYAPEEWPWSYWLMMAGHVAVLLGASARRGSLDAARAQGRAPVRLAMVFAAVATVAGLYSLVLSLGDPLAARGPGLVDSGVSLSLGNYNLLGALVLLVLAVLVVLAARGSRAAGLAGAALGVLAALSLHAQLGFTDPLLGGTPSSAAGYLCLALVSFSLTSTAARTSPLSQTRRTIP
jgi:uncharacterized membrane protein YphA (DoxX/SURF4 family)